jgi:hypothetical protein
MDTFSLAASQMIPASALLRAKQHTSARSSNWIAENRFSPDPMYFRRLKRLGMPHEVSNREFLNSGHSVCLPRVSVERKRRLKVVPHTLDGELAFGRRRCSGDFSSTADILHTGVPRFKTPRVIVSSRTYTGGPAGTPEGFSFGVFWWGSFRNKVIS